MHLAMIIPEDVRTSDRRLIAPGALTWRDNLPLMFVDRTTEGHSEAVHVGNVTNLRRETIDGQTWIVGDIAFDTDDDAREAMRLADEDKVAGLSADLGAVSADLEILATDDDGFPTDWLETVTAGEIIGVTQLPMPAFGEARITQLVASGRIVAELPAVTAAANPKATADWFANPNLARPTPLTVTDDGRIFGHLATWGTCHIGFEGACVTPPTSETDYAYFNLGCVTIDGEEIACGHITLGTGHAALSADSQAATQHYDHTGTVAGDVVAGEDEYGVWVAGAARPGVDLDVLRSASLSGDWRRVNGNLELVAALAVNVPGFPIPRLAASLAAGEQTTLVASGVVPQRDREDLIYEALTVLSAEVRALREQSTVVVEDPAPAEAEPGAPVGALARLLESTG